MALLIFLLTTAAVVPFGAQVLTRCGLAPRQAPERLLFSAAVGFTLLAYAVLVLGLTDHLTPLHVAIVLAAFAVLGLGHWDLFWESFLRLLNSMFRALRTPEHAVGTVFLVIVLLATLITALEPPTSRDFDGLAEHLAQAATYLRHHAVEPLWFDHHSHFPATMQMLYVVGLGFKSVGAAKLFHWFHGLMSVMAAIILSRRFFQRRASGWAGFVLATTPMFLWLSGSAYVDLGVMAYSLLALLAYLRWRRAGRTADLALMGVVLGCAMTVKMQAIALCGILLLAALAVALRRVPADNGEQAPAPAAVGVRRVVLCGLLAVGIACPWYIRTYANTGNPFYPFGYGVFGGKHWSADRASIYDRHQLDFGWGDLPSPAAMAQLPRWRQKLVGPREPWKWPAAPFALTYLPWEFEVHLGNFQNILLTSTGPLYLALIGALVGFARWRRSEGPDGPADPAPTGDAFPPAVARTLWLFLPLWLWWFWSMQLARYLFPSLALLAPVAGYGAYRCRHGGATVSRALTAAMLLWAGVATYTAAALAVPALPVVFGLQPQQDYLLRTTDVYTPSLAIRQLPADSRICTYGEVRCFYFDRDYFWGEPGHSDLIAYDQMRRPEELVARYRELGITHVLVNLQFLPGFWDSPDPPFSLLRQAMDSGRLELAADFPSRPQYRLYAVHYASERDP